MLKNIYKFILSFAIAFVLLSCEENNKKTDADKSEKEDLFPTHEKVEYVFACMQGNEDSVAYLSKCSCSIDYIESQMTYQEYINAKTIMSLRQIEGEKSVMFRHTPNAMEIYTNIQNILAEAEMECF